MPASWSPGSISWNELHSDAPDQNLSWYETRFGWQRAGTHDLGPNGVYQMFTTNDRSTTGGSCGKFGGEHRTHWLHYFSVDGLDAAVERVQNGGGRIFVGPHEVPGGTWIAIGTDPQGAVFALTSQKR